jgi:hypothetical protein
VEHALPNAPGRLYALPVATVFSTSVAGVPLGVARAAIDALTELAGSKASVGSPQVLRDKPAIQTEIGRAESIPRSARTFLFEAIQALWDAGADATLRDRALVRLVLANVGTSAAQVTDMMYRAGGSASLYEGCRLARCWRDAHAASQHLGLSSANYETAGRVMLGIDPGTTLSEVRQGPCPPTRDRKCPASCFYHPARFQPQPSGSPFAVGCGIGELCCPNDPQPPLEPRPVLLRRVARARREPPRHYRLGRRRLLGLG